MVDETEKLEKLNQFYLAIILRYKELIEEKEELSISELPTLVTPKDERVVAKAEEIKRNFLSYTYGRDFYEAAKRAFEFVKKEIDEIVTPVQFWLTPAETLSFRIGDPMDKNVLLCSLLLQLGNPSAKVLVEVNNAMSAFVYFEFNGKYYLLDIKSGIREFSGKDALYGSVINSDDSTAYEFNNQMYNDIK
ncbi:MAG: hypothetical protein QXW10_01100 [Candidatus Micrarchaeaceae archaeon]